jgi:hypothetical protein
MEYSPLFGPCQRIYEKNKDIAWLKKAVAKKAITNAEYKEICGKEYTAE